MKRVIRSRSSLVMKGLLEVYNPAVMWPIVVAGSSQCSETEAPDLDGGAAVHHHGDAGFAGAGGGVLIHHAELHPDHARAQPDGVIHHGTHEGARAKDVH